MQEGLVYNKDLKISGVTGLEEGTDYKLYETDRGFRLVFQDSGLTKVENAAKDDEVEITLTYSAHLDATVVPDDVKENNITFDYSNKPGFENEPTEVTPNNQEITVEKSWAADGKEITEADRHVKAVFTLQEKQEDGSWKDVDVHESNYNEGFTHTFENLDDNKTYRVVESVSGYEPEYQKTTEDGKVVIVNKIDNDNPTTLKPTNPKVVNYGKRFVKADSNTGERLQGAEFVVKNSEDKFLALKDDTITEEEKNALTTAKTSYDNAIDAWNTAVKENPDTADEEIQVTIDGDTITGKKAAKAKIKELQDAYEAAFEKAKNAYTWVASDDPAKDTTNNLVTLVSDEQGKFEITGLEKGTYQLVETKTPGKYAKLNDQEFKVGAGTYESHEDGVTYESDDSVNDDTGAEAQRIDNKLVSIPQTGGIGSVIFIVAGLAIMAGAFVAYKKSQAQEA